MSFESISVFCQEEYNVEGARPSAKEAEVSVLFFGGACVFILVLLRVKQVPQESRRLSACCDAASGLPCKRC